MWIRIRIRNTARVYPAPLFQSSIFFKTDYMIRYGRPTAGAGLGVPEWAADGRRAGCPADGAQGMHFAFTNMTNQCARILEQSMGG